MKILVTGGGGFVGSHAAELYAKAGNEVVVIDNLSRGKLLKKEIKNKDFNWKNLQKYNNITHILGDIRDYDTIKEAAKGCDAAIHTAAQTAVTTSVLNPKEDFTTNALGTFNVLEACRINKVKKVVYCSTNKVYGENVNSVEVKEGEKRHSFEDKFKYGIPEDFPIDLCEHTPYGCSKLTGDLYCQDYAKLYGLSVGIFRMSCIYGAQQFGVEDQGWVSWFTIATLLNKPIAIYGDGKQVRDVLYVEDLINLFDKFIESDTAYGVYNTGGGPENTLSLLELLDILEELTGKKSSISFSGWRPSDQKVYVSDIRKASKQLNWKPQVSPKDGIKKLVEFVKVNKDIF